MKLVGASNVLQDVKCGGRALATPSMRRSRKLTDQAFLVRGRIGLVGPAGMKPEIVPRVLREGCA